VPVHVMAQVVYSKRVARLLHSVPLALALAAPLQLHDPRGQTSLTRMYVGMLVAAVRAGLALVLAVLLPAVQGIARVAITGETCVTPPSYQIAALLSTPGFT
jgi:hypothetical protein